MEWTTHVWPQPQLVEPQPWALALTGTVVVCEEEGSDHKGRGAMAQEVLTVNIIAVGAFKKACVGCALGILGEYA